MRSLLVANIGELFTGVREQPRSSAAHLEFQQL